MNVNFNGFGENAATFIADKTLTETTVLLQNVTQARTFAVCA